MLCIPAFDCWSGLGCVSRHVRSRTSPSATLNTVLRRRLPLQRSSRQSAGWHSSSTAKLTEPQYSSSSGGADNFYLPFDESTSAVSSTSHGTSDVVPPPSTGPVPRRDSGGASEPEFQLHGPSIELALDVDPDTRTSDAHAIFSSSAGPTPFSAQSKPSQQVYVGPFGQTKSISHRRDAAKHQRRTELASSMKRQTRMTVDRLENKLAAPMHKPHSTREPWQIQKQALREKLGHRSWDPRKKVSPDAMEGIRALHAQQPARFTTPVLAEEFKLSPEAIRRILKSKWRPNAEEEEERRLRWDRRGEKIWSELVEKGIHAPKKWRTMGIGTGPRRPAQDRAGDSRLRSRFIDGRNDDANDGAAWMRSLAGRMI